MNEEEEEVGRSEKMEESESKERMKGGVSASRGVGLGNRHGYRSESALRTSCYPSVLCIKISNNLKFKINF